jgi:hypothetical protein
VFHVFHRQPKDEEMPRSFLPAARWVSRHRFKKRPGRIALIGITLLLALLFFLFGGGLRSPQLPAFYPFETTSAFFPVAQHDAQNKTSQELCASFPHHLMHRIQPVLKMGHGENPSVIDAQLESVSACFRPDELLVFSDLDALVHGHHAIDILADVPQAYRYNDEDGSSNRDFVNYDAMYALARDGKLTADNDPARGENGWRLDKYKFLAGVERAWLMRPGRDFYVFYESDTYISWDNMFRFLSTLDPQAPLYMGSPSPGRHDDKNNADTWFANGGPGYVLSRGAMEKLMGRRSAPGSGQFTEPPPSHRLVDVVRGDPCGDSILGWALWTAGVRLNGFFPLFTPFAVHTVPYTERLWCQPFLTMHKLRPEDMLDLWRWENGRRRRGRPLLYSDLYEFFPVPDPGVRHDWDNTNWDRLGPGWDVNADSLRACQKACEESTTCHQYHWQGGEYTKKCVLQPFINLGSPKKPETVRRDVPDGNGKARDAKGEQQFRTVEEEIYYTSGWMKSRIDRWVKDHMCLAPEWVHPSIERHY